MFFYNIGAHEGTLFILHWYNWYLEYGIEFADNEFDEQIHPVCERIGTKIQKNPNTGVGKLSKFIAKKKTKAFYKGPKSTKKRKNSKKEGAVKIA